MEKKMMIFKSFYSLAALIVLVNQARCFDECSPENHKTLDEEWRYHEYTSMKFNKQDDTQLKEGWYRFTNKAFRMLEKDEMFPEFVVKNRKEFRPSGSEPFQNFRFSPFPPRLYTRITPLYVVSGTHPDISGDLVKAEAIECYYESLLNSYGPTPQNAAMCSRESPERNQCSYKRFCVNSETVDIKIRHCGSYYVYHLKPVRKINRHKFFENPKSGLYCGTKKTEMVKPSAPCKCQLSEENDEILKSTKCNLKDELDEEGVKTFIRCLFDEQTKLTFADQQSAICVNKLWKAEHGQIHGQTYPTLGVKKQQTKCYDLRREFKNAINMKFELIKPLLER
eukprot:TCONS_00061943-protein